MHLRYIGIATKQLDDYCYCFSIGYRRGTDDAVACICSKRVYLPFKASSS
jgi:hypothetical protein